MKQCCLIVLMRSTCNIAKHVINHMQPNNYINRLCSVRSFTNLISKDKRKRERRVFYPLVAGKSQLALQKAISTETTEINVKTHPYYKLKKL